MAFLIFLLKYVFVEIDNIVLLESTGYFMCFKLCLC